MHRKKGHISARSLIISKLFHRIKNRALKEKSHTSSCRINLKIVQSKTVREQFKKKKVQKSNIAFLMRKVFASQLCWGDNCIALHTNWNSWPICQPWLPLRIQIWQRQVRYLHWTKSKCCLDLQKEDTYIKCKMWINK